MCRAMEEMREKSYNKGYEKGYEKGVVRLVVNMLKEGRMQIEEIAKISEMPLENIEKIKAELNI